MTPFSAAVIIAVSLYFAGWLVLWSACLVVRAIAPDWYRRNIEDDAPDGHW